MKNRKFKEVQRKEFYKTFTNFDFENIIDIATNEISESQSQSVCYSIENDLFYILEDIKDSTGNNTDIFFNLSEVDGEEDTRFFVEVIK